MRKILLGVSALAMMASAAWADVTKEDVKALLQAGVSEGVIVSYVNDHRPVRYLSREDLLELKLAGASNGLLAFLTGPSVTDSMYPDSYYRTYGYGWYGYYPFYDPWFRVSPFVVVPFRRSFFPHNAFFHSRPFVQQHQGFMGGHHVGGHVRR